MRQAFVATFSLTQSENYAEGAEKDDSNKTTESGVVVVVGVQP